MQVKISFDDVLAKFGRSLDSLGERGRTEIARGLHRSGEKMRTIVRRALKKQTSVKRYGAITEKTKSFMENDLTLVIEAKGPGLPIQDFPFRYSKSVAALVRWSPREHWRLQERTARGRFGALNDTSANAAAVRATMWGVRHAFKRSFGHPEKGPMMVRDVAKRNLRTLFGPSLSKEIVTGETPEAFEAAARTVVQVEIEKRLKRLLAKGG